MRSLFRLPRLRHLEDRLTPAFLISNTMDYDPTQYVPGNPLTFIAGSARFAIQQAVEAGGGEVRFDTTVDLDPGPATVHFGDAISMDANCSLSIDLSRFGHGD